MGLRVRFSLFTSALCLIIIGGVSARSYQLSYRELEQSLGARLKAIATSGAIEIDGDLHEQVRGEADVDSEAFQKIRERLRRLKRANGLKEEIYTFRRVGEQLHFVVMTHDKPFVGHTYSIRPEMLPTLNAGEPSHTGVYTDVHGAWLSAYAPIKDGQGRVVGLLEADVRVEEFVELTRSKFVMLAWEAAIFAVVAVILSFLLARTVTRRLVYLADVAEKISLGRTDTTIEVKGRDEVSQLARAMERMRESIRLASEMID